MQETFGVDVVVVAPVGDGGYGDGHLEGTFAFEHGEGGEVAAEAPSPDADAIFFNVGEGFQVVGSCDLVDGLVFSHLFVNHLLEVVAAPSRAASVGADHDVAFLCQHLIPSEIEWTVVGVANLL